MAGIRRAVHFLVAVASDAKCRRRTLFEFRGGAAIRVNAARRCRDEPGSRGSTIAARGGGMASSRTWAEGTRISEFRDGCPAGSPRPGASALVVAADPGSGQFLRCQWFWLSAARPGGSRGGPGASTTRPRSLPVSAPGRRSAGRAPFAGKYCAFDSRAAYRSPRVAASRPDASPTAQEGAGS